VYARRGGQPNGSRELSAELIDQITEAVVTTEDARDRADIIAELVHQVDEAVKWRNERHPGGAEERSLATLVDAAARHRARMSGAGLAADDRSRLAHSSG
jgi:hypothetical protein